jgi:hypothetical protein
MSDATFPCPVCGASLPARARFCGECGTPVRGAAALKGAPVASPNPILPWFIAGVAVIAIQTLALILALRPPAGPLAANEPDQRAAAAGAPGAPFASGGGTRATTDISGLTARQAADRLYDRIARASEANDSAQVQFFGPMALQAYANVAPLDIDARLHVGMIDIALGNLDAAAAQADSIVRTSRTHLFGPLLKARVAELRGNSGAARAAYQAFLANYDAERRKNLPEYEQHASVLADTRTAAQRTVRGR